MKRKKTVGRNLIIALLFFSLSTFFVMHVYADETELIEPRAIAIERVGGVFKKIEQNAEKYQLVVDTIADYLPEDSATMLNAVISVAQLDVSTEEKFDALIEITQSNCSSYALLWLTVQVLRDIIPYIPLLYELLSLLSSVGEWGLILCLLGII